MTRFEKVFRMRLIFAFLATNVLTIQTMAAMPVSKPVLEPDIRQQLIKVAAIIQEQEAMLSALEQELNHARVQEKNISEKSGNLEGNLKKTFYYLRQADNRSSLLALLVASKPEDIIHASILLRSITPKIHCQNQHLLIRIKELSQIRLQLERKQDELRTLMFEHYRHHEALNALSATPSSPESSPAAGETPAMFFKMPVAGKLVQTYGSQKPQWALWNQGVLFLTRKNAQVVSPLTGIVAYAGEYAGTREKMVIIQNAGDHVTLSGLGTLSCKAGQSVGCGEPVGRMPAPEPAKDVSSGQPVKLYMEIWRQEKTIDPLSVLKDKGDKSA